jgi:hypothetical protein
MKCTYLLVVGLIVSLRASPAFAWGVSSEAAAPPASAPASAPPLPEPVAPAPPPPPSEPVSAETATPLPGPPPPPPPGAAVEPPDVTLEEDTSGTPPVSASPFVTRRAPPPRETAPEPAVPTRSMEAPPDDAPPRQPRRPRESWYGWQTLILDGASIGLMFTGSTAAGWGVVSYLFAPSIVHFAHRNVGYGFVSIGMRFGLPFAGILMGAMAGSCVNGTSNHDCNGDAAVAGLLLGMAGAITVDAAVLAYEQRRPRRRASGMSVSPLLSLQPGDARVGLAGAF